MPTPNTTASTVLYDGSCPLCTVEINQYKKISLDGKINWVDVSSSEFVPPAGQSKEALMQRFHVIKPNGDLVSGAAAFVHVWEQLPGWNRLAKVAQVPGALDVMEFGYDKFLKIRPKIQSLILGFSRLCDKK
jgi:predicted DCC family thiol-disulfide oxidoreductase YuxK